jgi:hypothetical protein
LIPIQKLEQSHATAGVHLSKQGVDPAALPTIRTGLCLDVSGSMRHEYRDGHVQDALTHLLALAMHMDKSRRLDVFTFENDCAQCRYPATPDNFHSFVADHIVGDDSVPKWGGTDYLGVMQLVYQHYFGNSASASEHPSHGSGLFGRLLHRHQDPISAPVSSPAPAQNQAPTAVFFLTDGETENERAIERLMEAQAGLPLFWVFVGLAHQSRLLRDLGSEATGEFILLEDGVRISDDDLYRKLITPKFSQWLGSHSA